MKKMQLRVYAMYRCIVSDSYWTDRVSHNYLFLINSTQEGDKPQHPCKSVKTF